MMDHKVLYFRHRPAPPIRFRFDVRHAGCMYEVVQRPGDRVVLASSDGLFAYRYMHDKNREHQVSQ